MSIDLKIHNLFILIDGSTVLACDRSSSDEIWSNRRARLVCDGQVRQEFLIRGERVMSHQSSRMDQIAIDTMDTLQLTAEEAESGNCIISL